VTVSLNEKRDVYEALLSNLGVKGVEVSNTTVKQWFMSHFGDVGRGLRYSVHLYRGGTHCQP